jgi:phosphatidylserine decarboxylase
MLEVSCKWGPLLSVWIDANVCFLLPISIHESLRTPGYQVKKGEEIGMFQFGGSSIVVAFEKGRIIFDQDLEDYSMKRVMVDVEVGMSLGRASKS